MEIPYTVTARPDTGLWNAKVGIWLFLASEVMLFGGLFSAYVFLRLDAAPGAWPHGLLNVPVGTMNTAILIASSVTVVMAWASLKMRRFNAYWWYMLVTILCGVIFLAVKLIYEWPQKFDHFGAFIKKDALEKYEPYLGNHHLAEKGLPPRIEISGHLHNKEALHDPNVKEYEIALDPVNADPTNPEMDRPISSRMHTPIRWRQFTRKMFNTRQCFFPNTARILRAISRLQVSTDCTFSVVALSLKKTGCLSGRSFTNAILSILPIELRSPAYSGIL